MACVSVQRCLLQWRGETLVSIAVSFFFCIFNKTQVAKLTEEKQRMIQEYVPGKQLTLAHVIASPQTSIYQKLGLDDGGGDAIGILTITPGEAVIIAADVCTKAADIEIGFLDRFGGSLVIVGDISSVEASLNDVISMFADVLKFATVDMTRS